MGYNNTRVDVVGVAAPGRDVRSPNCPTCCPRVVAVCACVLTLLASVPAYAQPAPRNAPPATALNDALREENAEAIRAAVTAWNRQLGECGVAVLALYEGTKEKKYLDAGRKAADWALARPLVSNWNYNSFSVYLLARPIARRAQRGAVERCTQRAAQLSLHHAARTRGAGRRDAERPRCAPATDCFTFVGIEEPEQ
jgi:hypothetical protein